MANELMDKIMTEEELDLVAGGVGYGYIMKKSDGSYMVISSNQKLTVDQAKGLLNGEVPTKLGVNKDAIFSILRDVPADKLDVVKKRLNKVYDGCEFQDI